MASDSGLKTLSIALSVTGFTYHAICQISILDNDCYAELYLSWIQYLRFLDFIE